jgi:hypothetical protein
MELEAQQHLQRHRKLLPPELRPAEPPAPVVYSRPRPPDLMNALDLIRERYRELRRLARRAGEPMPPAPDVPPGERVPVLTVQEWWSWNTAILRWRDDAVDQLGRLEGTDEVAAKRGGRLRRGQLKMSLRRVGEVWHLRYLGEKANFAVKDCRFLGWLAKLLARPDHDWTMAELHGDPEGKLRADGLLGGMSAQTVEALHEIHKRITDIDHLQSQGLGTEALEKEKDELLEQVRGYQRDERSPSGIEDVYNNVTTQKRQFLTKLKKDMGMPRLAAHLRGSLLPSKEGYTIAYRPPAGTPRWHVENPNS